MSTLKYKNPFCVINKLQANIYHVQSALGVEKKSRCYGLAFQAVSPTCLSLNLSAPGSPELPLLPCSCHHLPTLPSVMPHRPGNMKSVTVTLSLRSCLPDSNALKIRPLPALHSQHSRTARFPWARPCSSTARLLSTVHLLPSCSLKASPTCSTGCDPPKTRISRLRNCPQAPRGPHTSSQ